MPSSRGRYSMPIPLSPDGTRFQGYCTTSTQRRDGTQRRNRRCPTMWRRLDSDDYYAVMALRQAVLSSLPDPDFYIREDDEEMFVRGHLDVFGESVGYFDGDDLVAYLALTTDLVSSGEDAEFAACAPTSADVVFAAAMVLPEYQGHSLH